MEDEVCNGCNGCGGWVYNWRLAMQHSRCKCGQVLHAYSGNSHTNPKQTKKQVHLEDDKSKDEEEEGGASSSGLISAVQFETMKELEGMEGEEPIMPWLMLGARVWGA